MPSASGSRIDPHTGGVTLNREVVPTKLDEEILVCPTLYGGCIWQATAYSPDVKALFMPLANMCNDYKVVEEPPPLAKIMAADVSRVAARRAEVQSGPRYLFSFRH